MRMSQIKALESPPMPDVNKDLCCSCFPGVGGALGNLRAGVGGVTALQVALKKLPVLCQWRPGPLVHAEGRSDSARPPQPRAFCFEVGNTL